MSEVVQKGFQKNIIRPILGVPLFVHSINQAKETKLFDYIVLSSDSDEILNIAKSYGVDVCIKRPDYLSQDTSPKLPVIQHCFEKSEEILKKKFDIIIDLDATSPLREMEDIQNVVKMLENSEEQINIITGSPSKKSPYFNLVEVDNEGFVFLSGVKKNWEEMIVDENDNIQVAIRILSNKNQIVFVLDDNQILKGTITDRDIKKGLINSAKLDSKCSTFMNSNPKFIFNNTDEEEIYKIFNNTEVLHLPVIDSERRLISVRNMSTVTRRQDSPSCYDLNASVYGWWRRGLINSKNIISDKTKLFIMPEERSIDIDTELDFKWVEFLMKNQ